MLLILECVHWTIKNEVIQFVARLSVRSGVWTLKKKN